MKDIILKNPTESRRKKRKRTTEVKPKKKKKKRVEIIVNNEEYSIKVETGSLPTKAAEEDRKELLIELKEENAELSNEAERVNKLQNHLILEENNWMTTIDEVKDQIVKDHDAIPEELSQ